MSEPKPCPFCKSELLRVNVVKAWSDNDLRGSTPWCIECWYCDADGPTRKTIDEAIEFWNRAPRAIEERLIDQMLAAAHRRGAVEALNEIVDELGVRARMSSTPEQDMKALFRKIENLFRRYKTEDNK